MRAPIGWFSDGHNRQDACSTECDRNLITFFYPAETGLFQKNWFNSLQAIAWEPTGFLIYKSFHWRVGYPEDAGDVADFFFLLEPEDRSRNPVFSKNRVSDDVFLHTGFLGARTFQKRGVFGAIVFTLSA